MSRELIVAYGNNREIGERGDMPWGMGLRGDTRRFRELTIRRNVIMGRKTLESMGRALPDRCNIVVTSHKLSEPDLLCVRSLAEAIKLAKDDCVVIGGRNMYAEALAFVDLVHATEVDAEFPKADVFFPELPPDFSEVHGTRRHQPKDRMNSYPFDWVDYRRISAD